MSINEGATFSGITSDVVYEVLHLDRAIDIPLFQQIYQQIRDLITDRKLKESAVLPSTRMLASDLCVSRNTVMVAYEQLETEGYIETTRGSRATVASLTDLRDTTKELKLPDLGASLSGRGRSLIHLEHQTGYPKVLLLQPGLPDARDFPFAKWRRLFSEQLRMQANESFGYHSHAGDPNLREIIANYMSTSRGLKCRADQVMITTGAQGAFNLLAQLLIDVGDPILMEEPGYTGARGAFLAAGADIKPIKVEGKFWDLDAITQTHPKLIYLTPSCQFPLGTTMRIEQRLKLLQRASEENAWVIEDDFDSEFSFLGRRLPTLQYNDPLGRTIYVGSFAKTMLPDLRLGFIIFPGKVVRNIRKANFLLGTAPSLAVQGALANFIGNGHFARHTRSVKRLYDGRRKLLDGLIVEHLGDWMEQLDEGNGMQTTWRFTRSVDDVEVARRALTKGLGPTPLSIHYFHGKPTSGLMIGYASTDEGRYAASLKILRMLVEQVAKDVGQQEFPR